MRMRIITFLTVVCLVATVSNAVDANVPSTPCSASLTSALSVHLPIIEIGNQYYWADLDYTGTPPYFSLRDYGRVTDLSPFLSCYPASLYSYSESNSTLHAPSAIYNDVSYWIDFKYSGGIGFEFLKAGENFPIDFQPKPVCEKDPIFPPPFSFPVCSCLKKRWIPDKPVHTEINPNYDFNFIDVKFVEGSKIRMRYGKLVSLNGTSLSSYEEVISKYVILGTQRTFTSPEDDLDREKFTLEQKGCDEFADFNLFYRIQFDPQQTDPEALIDDLNSLEIVEIASPHPRGELP